MKLVAAAAAPTAKDCFESHHHRLPIGQGPSGRRPEPEPEVERHPEFGPLSVMVVIFVLHPKRQVNVRVEHHARQEYQQQRSQGGGHVGSGPGHDGAQQLHLGLALDV